MRIGDQVVPCLGWASAAWKVKDRDHFIGWNKTSKRTHLHLIASNVRFLIPPWVMVKHLASKVLSLAIRRLSNEWKATYGHPVYLAETFVGTARFQGTCYQASNWIKPRGVQNGAISICRKRPETVNAYQAHTLESCPDLVGISVNNIVKMVSVFFNLRISAGGLTQTWKALVTLLEPPYNDMGQKISTSAVLHADETGWRKPIGCGVLQPKPSATTS